MRKIANTRQLHDELQALIRYTSEPRPSRVVLASKLAYLSARVAADSDPIDVALAFNLDLAKRLQGLKRDAGATTIKGNYKGIGTKRARRQMYVSFKSGRHIDLWLETDKIRFRGILANRGIEGPSGLVQAVEYGGRNPEQVYREVSAILSYWNSDGPAAMQNDDHVWASEVVQAIAAKVKASATGRKADHKITRSPHGAAVTFTAAGWTASVSVGTAGGEVTLTLHFERPNVRTVEPAVATIFLEQDAQATETAEGAFRWLLKQFSIYDRS